MNLVTRGGESSDGIELNQTSTLWSNKNGYLTKKIRVFLIVCVILNVLKKHIKTV